MPYFVYVGPYDGGKAVVSADLNTPNFFDVIYSNDEATNPNMWVGDLVELPNKEHPKWEIFAPQSTNAYRIGLVTEVVHRRWFNYYVLTMSFGTNEKPVKVKYRGYYQPLITDRVLLIESDTRPNVYQFVHNISWGQRLWKLTKGKIL